jgi:hypothetical protein
MYESEHTKFMREWLQGHAEELAVQRAGRALWWDKAPRRAEAQRREAEAQVPRKPYCYDAN